MSEVHRSSKMKYVRLGKSGLKVSKIILGCMSYGTSEWLPWVLDEEESLGHIKAAYDLGINTFDTANMYSNGVSEIVLGKAIKKFNLPREEIVVMTKVFFPVKKSHAEGQPPPGTYINQQGLSRKHIFDSVKASLERLQLDYIDLLQFKLGLVRYIGMSSCWAYQFHAMQNYAITNKLTPFVSMQNLYNLLYREEEREMLPTLKYLGVGCIPWSPLARGNLSRPLSRAPVEGEEAKEKLTKRQANDKLASFYLDYPKDINSRVEELAQKKGWVEIAFIDHTVPDPETSTAVTAPIVGVTKIENLKELVESIHVELTPEEKAYLEEKYVPRQTYGFH